MGNTWRRDGKTQTLQAAPYAVSKDNGVKLGSKFGIAVADIASGASGEIVTDGVHELSCILASDTWTEGVKLYWDDASSPRRLTTSAASGANLFAGIADQAKAGAATKGTVKLLGMLI